MDYLRNLIPLVIFLVFPSLVITQNDPSWGYSEVERNALYSLKSDFHHTFLTKNWTGLPCYLNNPPRWFGIRCTNGRVTELLLPDMSLTGKVNIHAFVNLTDLSTLSFRNNSISGNVMDFTFNTKLKRIDLSDNKFYGPISRSLLSLDVLESLQLQGNNLTGSIPEFDQQSLKEFNVSHNNFYGEIPQTEILQSFTMSSYFYNPGLCGKPSLNHCNDFIANDDTSTAADKKKALGAATLISIFVVLDIIGLVIVVFLFYLYYKKIWSKKKEVKVNEVEVVENENLPNGETSSPAAAKQSERKLTFLSEIEHFELNDLFKASAEGLGKGNFGNVYKAKLENGPSVVVKRLRDLRPLSDEEFADQMRAVADLKHPNLLPPLAYYYSKDEKLVVHKFMQNGNLFSRLFGRRGNNRVPFKWNSRLNVAQSVARAMEFLHVNTRHTNIPHGNLKSSNILLDANETAIVSDYGLASLIAQSISSQRMTAYKCPEYHTRKKLSKKADVWCYGALLLELLTGKISTYSAPQGVNGVELGTWVHRAVREEWTAEIFDIEISTQRNASDGMLRLLQIALKCCEKSPEKRLDMEEVVTRVEEIKICDSEEDYSSEVSYADFRLQKKDNPATLES